MFQIYHLAPCLFIHSVSCNSSVDIFGVDGASVMKTPDYSIRMAKPLHLLDSKISSRAIKRTAIKIGAASDRKDGYIWLRFEAPHDSFISTKVTTPEQYVVAKKEVEH